MVPPAVMKKWSSQSSSLWVVPARCRTMELSCSQGYRERVERVLRPVLTIVGGTTHRAAEVPIPLRAYLDADREVDCAVPI